MIAIALCSILRRGAVPRLYPRNAMSRQWILLAALGAGIELASGCASAPTHVAGPIGSTDGEFDTSTPEGTLRLFLDEARRGDWAGMTRLSRSLDQPPDFRGGIRCTYFAVRQLIDDPTIVRFEFSFSKSVAGSRRVANLVLVRQNEVRFRGTAPLEMIKLMDRGWIIDYGWGCALSSENFSEWAPQ